MIKGTEGIVWFLPW